MSIQLPSRKWYTLEQAAAKLTREAGEPVTVEDLLHFWATQQIEISVWIDLDPYIGLFIGKKEISPNEIRQLEIMTCNQSQDENIFMFINEFYSIINCQDQLLMALDDMENCEELNEEQKKESIQLLQIAHKDKRIYSDFKINGFLSILNFSQEYSLMREKEIMMKGINPIVLNLLSPIEYNANGSRDVISMSIKTDYRIPIEYLYILCHDLDRFKQNSEIVKQDLEQIKLTIEKPRSPKTLNRQAEFIRDLLAIQYGEDYPNRIRRELDNANSEIRKDFETKGLTPPSGKTVEKWLNK